MTLTWGQLLELTFLGRIIYVPFYAARKEKDVGVQIILLYVLSRTLLLENDLFMFRPFLPFWPVEAQQLTWGRKWRHIKNGAGQQEMGYRLFFSTLLSLL